MGDVEATAENVGGLAIHDLRERGKGVIARTRVDTGLKIDFIVAF